RSNVHKTRTLHRNYDRMFVFRLRICFLFVIINLSNEIEIRSNVISLHDQNMIKKSPYNFENMAQKFLRSTLNATAMREDEVNMLNVFPLCIHEKASLFIFSRYF